MKVLFGDMKIEQNKVYKSDLLKSIPKIKSSKIKGINLYTIIIIDHDAPYPSNPIYKYKIHFMLCNSNQEIFKYKGPSPPEDSEPHRYTILIYSQDERITKFPEDTSNFNLDNFVFKNDLHLLDEFTFKAKK